MNQTTCEAGLLLPTGQLNVAVVSRDVVSCWQLARPAVHVSVGAVNTTQQHWPATAVQQLSNWLHWQPGGDMSLGMSQGLSTMLSWLLTVQLSGCRSCNRQLL